MAVDRLNLTHRWIFFGLLVVSKIVELIVNIEKQISCLKIFISSFSEKKKVKELVAAAAPHSCPRVLAGS